MQQYLFPERSSWDLLQEVGKVSVPRLTSERCWKDWHLHALQRQVLVSRGLVFLVINPIHH